MYININILIDPVENVYLKLKYMNQNQKEETNKLTKRQQNKTII